jgi:hypothetical protein
MEPMKSAGYLLCFDSMFHTGRGYAFPCDQAGCVDLDALNDVTRSNYLYARAMVGREFSAPAVKAAAVT